jgi:hypothetical protein
VAALLYCLLLLMMSRHRLWVPWFAQHIKYRFGKPLFRTVSEMWFPCCSGIARDWLWMLCLIISNTDRGFRYDSIHHNGNQYGGNVTFDVVITVNDMMPLNLKLSRYTKRLPRIHLRWILRAQLFPVQNLVS